MNQPRHSKGASDSKGGQFAESEPPRQTTGGTPLTLEQVDDLRALVSTTDTTPITDMDLAKILDKRGHSPTCPPPIFVSPQPQEPTERTPAFIEEIIAFNSEYLLTEHSKQLLTMSDEQLAAQLDDPEVRYCVSEVDDWIADNSGAAARRFGEWCAPAEVLDDETFAACRYNDPFFGPVIRAFVSLEPDPPMIQRPSNDQVLSTWAGSPTLRRKYLNVLNGDIGSLNVREYDRLWGEISKTEVIDSLQTELRELRGDTDDTPTADYVELGETTTGFSNDP